MERHRAAVAAVEQRARSARDEAVSRLEAAVGAAEAARLGAAALGGHLTVNFHPDRVGANGRTAAAGLAESGRYESQWTTWTSAGGRMAVAGGPRERWEAALFDGAYLGADPATADFPIYGTWDPFGDPHGGSPRFGSCFLMIEAHVRSRVTICVGDSHVGPTEVGTFGEPLSVIAALAEQSTAGFLLGRPIDPIDFGDLIERRSQTTAPSRMLDPYVEAQVHGGIDLHQDVAAIVADPSFRDTRTGDQLQQAADRHGAALRWHAGSRLGVDDVPVDFRGPQMPSIARRAAGDRASFEARDIGTLLGDQPPSPPSHDGDADDSWIQQVKYLWHTLLAFGADAEPT